MTLKKYVINVDFPTSTARIHLNPNFFDGMWCRLDEDKKIKDGGKIFVNTKEASNYLVRKKPIYFKGKEVKNVINCLNCSQRGKQSVHWDIKPLK